MKELIIILLGILSSCSGPTNELEAKVNTNNENIPFDKIIHFEYKNHQYIKFVEKWPTCEIVGIVHDPNCKCYE